MEIGKSQPVQKAPPTGEATDAAHWEGLEETTEWWRTRLEIDSGSAS